MSETITVDIDGIEVTVAKELGEKLISKRQASKQSVKELSEKLGKLEADKNAAESAKLKAEEDTKILELAGKKETQQIRELLEKKNRDDVERFSTKIRDSRLKSQLATNTAIVPSAIDDVVEQIRSRTKYDFENDQLVVLDEAGQPLKDDNGKPKQVDTWLPGWLEKRPHYLLDKTPAGSGASGGKKTATGPTMSLDSLDAMAPLEKAKFFASGGTVT